ncbi:MAG: type I restriction enzyme HsdR N-terminal domain-containing protein [Synergistaceae bacterium]|nr:type I restriction enzyme HsdR N-terminal domain-containing protein [Synergistaceae bacterium]
MELIDSIRQIAKVYTERKDIIQTEEATKTALIMPFIGALGYNVFDPTEVVPEYTADVGIKKGEKVDYAIIRDGKPIMLIEAKWSGEILDVSKESQLMRYFNATPAKIGILTNGHEYRFYTDLDQDNIMDMMPFLQFSICDISEQIVRELKRFAKGAFKIEEIASTASELKYTGAMKLYLMEQLSEPSEDFVRHMALQVFTGRLTESVREKFKVITKKAFTQFISDRVSDRLASALSEEKAANTPADPPQETTQETPAETKSKIVTTQDEIDGFNAVKAILRTKVDVTRITLKDTINYCNVLLDGNIRKPLCRFYFNNAANKFIAFFDTSRKEMPKVHLETVDDIYLHADKLDAVIEVYLSSEAGKIQESEPE